MDNVIHAFVSVWYQHNILSFESIDWLWIQFFIHPSYFPFAHLFARNESSMPCWRGWTDSLANILPVRRERRAAGIAHLSVSISVLFKKWFKVLLSPYHNHGKVRKILCKESSGKHSLRLRGERSQFPCSMLLTLEHGGCDFSLHLGQTISLLFKVPVMLCSGQSMNMEAKHTWDWIPVHSLINWNWFLHSFFLFLLN